jgi:ribosomal protein S18 acetylase RimI-like enzyme
MKPGDELNMKIRPAALTDMPAIRAFDRVGQEDPRRLKYIEECINKGEAWAIVVEDCVCGYFIFNNAFYCRPFLSLIYIDERFRGRGLGREALRWCKRRAGGPFFVSTNQSNVRMIHLLRSEHFLDSGVIYNLDPGDPELVFYWPGAKE